MSRLSIFIFSLVFSLCFTYGVIAFDPNSVSIETRQNWCTNQQAVCTNSCQDSGNKNATVNTCNATNLDYSCVCSDGKSPNPNNYTLTIPYFECTADVQTCTNGCGADQPACVKACQKNCTANVTARPQSSITGSPTSTSTSTSSTSSSPTPFDVNGTGSAVSLSIPTINVCFVALLTILFVSFARF